MDALLFIALICAVGYLIIQVLIVVLVTYKSHQDKQIRKSLDRFRSQVKQDTRRDKK